MNKKLTEIVVNLNTKYIYSTYCKTGIWGDIEPLENHGVTFDCASNGCCEIISFNDIVLWNSDDDGREWDDDIDDHCETIEEFVEKEYIALVSQMYDGIVKAESK